MLTESPKSNTNNPNVEAVIISVIVTLIIAIITTDADVDANDCCFFQI